MFCTEGEKTAPLLDNCPEHRSISDLTNIQLIFLPPNTTSVLQLMDQAPLGTLRLITEDMSFDKGQPYPKISILQALKILFNSRETVTQKSCELIQEGWYYF